MVWRNAAIFLHGTGTCVVGSQRQALIAVELLQQAAQKTCAAIQALGRIERVGDPQAARGGVHQLGQTLGAGAGLRVRIEVGFLLDDARQQGRVDAVLVARRR